MSHGPLVTIVIPCFNAAAYLAEAVRGSLAQTYEFCEILIIDDGSTDSSMEIASGFGDSVTIIKQRNAGPSAARNTGLRAARGEYVSFLDADDRISATKLERQVPVLCSNPSVGIVYSWYREIDSVGSPSVTRRPEWRGNVFHELKRGNFIPTSGALVRRSSLERVGGFDTTLRYAEDWDLWLRVARSAEVELVPEVLSDYRNSPGSLSKNRFQMIRSIFRVIRKHANVHRNCEICRSREQEIRAAYGGMLRDTATEAQRRGHLSEAARWYWRTALVSPSLISSRRVVQDMASLAAAFVSARNRTG